jgi:hypothetical protein
MAALPRHTPNLIVDIIALSAQSPTPVKRSKSPTGKGYFNLPYEQVELLVRSTAIIMI